MPEIAVAGFISSQRNLIGQYTRRGLAASRRSVEEQLRESETIAQVHAPVRTGELVNSIGSRMTGAYEGVVEATAAHAAPQNFGAARHDIGYAGQFLTNRRDFAAIGPVDHPGNPPVGFMDKALDAAEDGLFPKLRRNWPG